MALSLLDGDYSEEKPAGERHKFNNGISRQVNLNAARHRTLEQEKQADQ